MVLSKARVSLTITSDQCSSSSGRKHQPLANHVATVSAYINRYGNMEDISERTTLSWKFLHYLVSTCWQKMHRRITHWSSQGFISNLGEITEDHVQSAFISRSSHLELEEGPDFVLGDIVTEWSIEDVMNYPNIPSSTKTYLELPNLRAVFKAELKPEQAYNVNTCVKFHRLLVNILIGYRRVLGALKKVISAEMDETNQS
jgi:hypothetical protein